MSLGFSGLHASEDMSMPSGRTESRLVSSRNLGSGLVAKLFEETFIPGPEGGERKVSRSLYLYLPAANLCRPAPRVHRTPDGGFYALFGNDAYDAPFVTALRALGARETKDGRGGLRFDF